MPGKQSRDSESYQETGKNPEISIDESILTKLSGKDSLIIRLFQETGIKLVELCELNTEDIDFQTHSISIKGTRARTISIGKALSLQLRNHATTGPLFKSRHGKRTAEISIRKQLSRISEKYRLSIGARVLRRGFAEKELRRGNTTEVKTKLGIKRLDEKTTLTEQEIGKLRATAKDHREQLILDTLFESGCRLSELVNLKRKNIGKNQLRFGARATAISEKLSADLTDFTSKASANTNIFSSRQADRLSEKRVFQIIAECSKKAGVGANQQLIRNSYLARLKVSNISEAQARKESGIRHLYKFHLYGALQHE